MNLTQPSLSQRIRALEREIGADLFERDRRGVALTTCRYRLPRSGPQGGATMRTPRRRRPCGPFAARSGACGSASL